MQVLVRILRVLRAQACYSTSTVMLLTAIFHWPKRRVAGKCRAFMNPGAGKRRTGISSSPWAAQEGQDFLANHVVPSVDLITTHVWSDNWMG